MIFPLAMALALAIDAILGWPNSLYSRIGHPVTWIGAIIRWADARFNQDEDSHFIRKRNGILFAIFLIGGVGVITTLVQIMIPANFMGICAIAVLAWPLVAARSMYTHVQAVSEPLLIGDIQSARHAVAMIVGRDVSSLDTICISRAGLESLAENTSDGIIAPLFWGALLGLPGIAAYKVINTLDSMVGYRTPRHNAFGWASARMDDLANWVPARLTGLLFALVSNRFLASWRVMLIDAHKHRSPNAGWPEAAMAGALNVNLSGPRLYSTGPTDDPYVNAMGIDPTSNDLERGLKIYKVALWLFGIFLLLIALIRAAIVFS